MTTDDEEWLALLRSVDQAVQPFAFVRPVDGSPRRAVLDESAADVASRDPYPSWVPPDFDREAMQARFDRLAVRLGEKYGVALTADTGPPQDAFHFGVVTIPAEVTGTRVKRSRARCRVSVMVSNFGGLAVVSAQPVDQFEAEPPVSPSDQERIEPVVTGLGYRPVPQHILATPYDGRWFDPHTPTLPDDTWYRRYFGWGLF
jgi:hypothetical protein